MALYAFDGTWNVVDRKDPLGSPPPAKYGVDRSAGRDTVETNVNRFMEYYGQDDTEYLEGVGTRFWWLGRVLGGGFGAGGKRRVRRMYRALMKRFTEGDTVIDIVGFSRGAAMAVHFANVVAIQGVRNPAGRRHLFLWYFPELGITFRHPKERLAGGDDVRIDLLGIWDTVATFGFPVGKLRNRSPTWHFKQVPDIVERCMHAMALDEVRATFELVQVEGSNRGQVYAVWFRGVHSNIGGGYVDRGLSDLTLAWMMEQAVWTWNRLGRREPDRFSEALAMLDPDHPGEQPDSWAGSNLETLEPDPDGELGRPFDVRRGASRPLGTNPLIHHSVRLRKENLMADHYSTANRRLLRRIPKHVQWTYDPPIHFQDRQKDVLRDLAIAAFVRIPVNPSEWLRMGSDYIFRSDDWVGYGPRESRHDPDGRKGRISRDQFTAIAEAWVKGRKPSPAEPLDVGLPDTLGHPLQSAGEVKNWVVQVLGLIDEHLPWNSEIARLGS